MERNVRYIWIGGIFFVILVCMIFFVLWLNRFELNSAKYEHYYAYSFDEVGGVGTNTPIRYKGISVGRVLNVDFKDIKEGVIQISMLIDSQLVIKQNAKVVVSSQGLAGANYLSIIQGDGQPIQTDSDGRKVLELDKGSIEKIMAKASELSDDVSLLMKNLNKTFNEESLHNIAQSIEQLRQATASFQSIANQIDRNIKNGEYNLREILTPTLLQFQGSLQGVNRFFDSATQFVEKVDKNPYDSLFGKQNTESKGKK